MSAEKIPVPGPIPEGDRTNFQTIKQAAKAGRLALLSAVRKADGKRVSLIVAMGNDGDGNYYPTPLGVMVEGDPYKDFYDPTV